LRITALAYATLDGRLADFKNNISYILKA